MCRLWLAGLVVSAFFVLVLPPLRLAKPTVATFVECSIVRH